MPEARMRFADMMAMEAPQDKHSGGKDLYHPTAAIVIAGTNDPPGLYDDLIIIYLQYFRRDSIDKFMRFLHSKRPDLLPAGWISRILKPANAN